MMPVGIQQLHHPAERSMVSRIDERSSNWFLPLNPGERSPDALLTGSNLQIISTIGSDDQAVRPAPKLLTIREPHEHVADIQVELIPIWHRRQKGAFRSSIGEFETTSGILEKEGERTTATTQILLQIHRRRGYPTYLQSVCAGSRESTSLSSCCLGTEG